MSSLVTEQNSAKREMTRWPFFVILGLTFLIEIAAGVVSLRRYGLSAFSIYLLVATGVLVMVTYCWNTFFVRPKKCTLGITSPALLGKIVLVDFACAIILEVGTLVGALTFSPLRIEDWHVGRIAVFFFAALVVSLLVVEYAPAREERTGEALITSKAQRAIREDVPRVIILMLACALVIVLARFLSRSTGISWLSLSAFLLAALVVVLALLGLARDISWRPERAFTCISLAVGLALIIPFPATNLNSWDDEVHFRNANALSYITNVEQSSSTRMMETIYALEPGFSQDAAFGRYWQGAENWSQDQVSEFSHELDQNNVAETTDVTGGLSYILMQFSFIGYIPSATALWLARLLHLPFTIGYALGRVANLVSYTFVCSLAIRKIPCKKTLLIAVALLPTNIFLAANYSYDAWLTSWLMLAVALTIRELQSPEILTTSRLASLLIVYLFALGPKAVYFPLIALLMLLPKEKYKSPRQKLFFYMMAIIMAMLIVATFAFAFLGTAGGSSGDVRGGSDVSGPEQFVFITENFPKFTQSILKFIFEIYLTPSSFSFAFTAFAYWGYPSELFPISSGILVGLILLLSLLEGTGIELATHRVKRALWCLFLCLVIVVLSCIALYISFTPVGADTVAGMQPRYLLPLIFPLCAITLNIPHSWRPRKKILLISTLSISSLYLIGYTWFLFFSRVTV